MFDGVKTGANSVGNALPTVSMGRHAHAGPMGLLANGRHFFVGHFLVDGLNGGVVGAVARDGGIHLDQVNPTLDLFTGRLATFPGTVTHASATGNGNVRRPQGLSICPPVMVSPWPETRKRGPVTIPRSIALRNATST